LFEIYYPKARVPKVTPSKKFADRKRSSLNSLIDNSLPPTDFPDRRKRKITDRADRRSPVITGPAMEEKKLL
jgi:hypothetical protein